MKPNFILVLVGAASLSGCYDFALEPHCAARPELCDIAITALSPSSGAVDRDNQVVVSGHGFDETVEVLAGDLKCKVLHASFSELLVAIPPHEAGSAPLVVVSGDRRVEAPLPYVWSGPPVIETASPTMIVPYGSSTVVITGRNLGRTEKVLLGQVAAPFQRISDTEVRVTVEPYKLPEGVPFTLTVVTGAGEATGPALVLAYRWGRRTDGVSKVLTDPGAPSVLYVVTRGGNIDRSADYGATFASLPWTPSLGVPSIITIEDGVTFVGTPSGLHISFDHGQTWSAGADTTSQLDALAAIHASGWSVYALIGGKLHVSTDLGDSWTAVGDISGTSLAAFEGKLYIGDSKSLRVLNPGSTTDTLVETLPADWLAVATGLMFGNGAAAYTMTPGFEVESVGLPTVTGFGALPDRSGWILAAGSQIYLLKNGTLTSTAPGLTALPVTSIAAAPQSDDIVYVVQDGELRITKYATWP